MWICVKLSMGFFPRSDGKISRRTYSADYSCAIADVWDVTKGFGVASEKRVPNPKSRGRDISAAIDNRRTDDVSVHSILRTSFKHESVRLAIEHVLVNGFDVVLVCIVPDFTVRIEVSRSAVIDPIARTTNVNQLALGTVDFRFLASDDGGDEIASERVSGVDRDVVLFTQSADLLGFIESADGKAVRLESGLELVFGLRAADIGRHGPVWVSTLDGFYVGCLRCYVSLAISRTGMRHRLIPPT